jgi:hypothetical protein
MADFTVPPRQVRARWIPASPLLTEWLKDRDRQKHFRRSENAAGSEIFHQERPRFHPELTRCRKEWSGFQPAAPSFR